jgi:hypothetical protein
MEGVGLVHLRGHGHGWDWKADVALLDEMHRGMRAAVAALEPGDLQATTGKGRLTNGMLVRGVALHDVYHAGQIQYVRQLYAAGAGDRRALRGKEMEETGKEAMGQRA